MSLRDTNNGGKLQPTILPTLFRGAHCGIAVTSCVSAVKSLSAVFPWAGLDRDQQQRVPHQYAPTFGWNDQRLAARSRTRLTQPERVSFALAAAASYRALRSALTLNVRYRRSPFSFFGAPRGFLAGCSMPEVCINK